MKKLKWNWNWLYWLICRLSLGLVHLDVEWKDDGIHCLHCPHFKDKATHIADLNVGGGW